MMSGGPAGRHVVLAHALRVLSTSRWADHLVLRGSVTLWVWLGVHAREPADIDFVVAARAVGIGGPQNRAIDEGTLVDGVVAALVDDPLPGMLAEEIEIDTMSGYYYGHVEEYPYKPIPRLAGTRLPARLPFGFQEERADQRLGGTDESWVTRLLLPYRAGGGGREVLQIDLAFGEKLPEEPVMVEVPPDIRIFAATPALSLAWKIYWLLNDVPARGKDLYDAVLLAERMSVPLDHVCQLLRRLEDRDAIPPLHPGRVDWDGFRAAYPDVDGDARSWLTRLGMALAAA